MTDRPSSPDEADQILADHRRTDFAQIEREVAEAGRDPSRHLLSNWEYYDGTQRRPVTLAAETDRLRQILDEPGLYDRDWSQRRLYTISTLHEFATRLIVGAPDDTTVRAYARAVSDLATALGLEGSGAE